MRIVAISDTHNLHRHYGLEPWGNIPDGDLLIHCGDVTTHGREAEVEEFLGWFQRQPHRHKIWIAGNHDRCLEGVDVRRRWFRDGVIYLEDEEVEIQGLRIWGSPYTPDHHDFAFQLHDTGPERWRKIPEGIDVLITHGPPFGILDSVHGVHNAGCHDLTPEVLFRVLPQVHFFGHIHEGYGTKVDRGVKFVNAAVHTWLWKLGPRHDPQIVDVSPRG